MRRVVDMFKFMPGWAIVVGVVGLAALTAILVFGGRDW